MLSLLALGRSESLKKEIADLNRNEKENKLLADTFNQLMKIDADSVLLIFRSLLTAYPQESSQQLLGLLLTDMFYITSDDDWIKETFTLINPQLDDEVLLIAFKQAYDMNINE
jgi:hypothetical protein